MSSSENDARSCIITRPISKLAVLRAAAGGSRGPRCHRRLLLAQVRRGRTRTRRGCPHARPPTPSGAPSGPSMVRRSRGPVSRTGAHRPTSGSPPWEASRLVALDGGKNVVLSYRSLESALLKIAESRKLFWVNVGDYKMLGTTEGIAHELAHALDLGPDFEVSLRAMGDVEADEREMAALRIEVAALAALGVRLSMRRLWVTANWRDGMPSLVQLCAPLNRHEQDRVERFIAIVMRENPSTKPRRSSGDRVRRDPRLRRAQGPGRPHQESTSQLPRIVQGEGVL